MSGNRPIGRRGLLGTMAAAGVAGFVPGRPARAQRAGAWEAWKARFLAPDGRVIDQLQDGASHSEGQGYGMLIAQAFGDRSAFAAMDGWAARVLDIRGDGLMAWRWQPGATPAVADRATATDGDLFRAWALLRAERQSGWAEAAGRAGRIAEALAARCLAPDPRAPAEPLLAPAAESPRDSQGVLFNPSYVMSRALRELGAAFDSPALIRAADHGETVLRELTEGGLVPDWTLVTPAGFRAAEGYSTHHGYDALRVALYLVWSGRRDHPAVAARAQLPAAEGGVPTVVQRDGTVLTRSSYPGYAALNALVTCRPQPSTPSEEPYYPATLGLMAEIAAREGDSCPHG